MKPLSGNSIIVIGTMSGTSLDGLDLAAVEFNQIEHHWHYEVLATETIAYPAQWTQILANAHLITGQELIHLHTLYGKFIAQEAIKFMEKKQIKPVLIASHGHTIFHQPENGFTFQLGSGAEIAALTGIETVADFRITDMALGGQGAPLVPAGDHLLFPHYTWCLNLGGFANISFIQNGERKAFDICPVNFILNHIARSLGQEFDAGGYLGRQGTIDDQLLQKLNRLKYYRMQPPKSLGREWMEKNFLPLVDQSPASEINKMRTIYEHISLQIAECAKGPGKLLITGGGALNDFLVEQLKQHLQCELVIPEEQLIQYKEAIIFAFLGLLKALGQINCFASVTGARKDSSSGIIFNVLNQSPIQP